MKVVPFYAVVILILGALVASIHGSSHSESPNTAKMPQADNTDFYMFRSYEPNRLDDHFVTFIVNVQGLQNPYAGPNYFSLSDAHFYEIYIDNTGDGVEDKVYQFMYGTRLGGKMIKTTTRPSDFDCNFVPQNITLNGGITLPIGPNKADIAIPLKFAGSILPGNNAALNWFEYYTLTAISGNKDSNVQADFTIATGPSAGDKVFTKPFDNVGEKTFPQYEDYANQYIYDVNVPFCGNNPKFGKVFVGQRTEPFFINLGAIFDLINFVPIPGFPNAITQDYANNDLAQKNIDSFILEVPTPCLTVDGQPNGIIGAWTVIRELIHGPGGSHVPGKQVSRLGNPLINELVIGLYDKYLFNSVGPHNDVANFGKYVLFPTLPAVVNLLFLDAVNSVLGTNLQTIAPATPRIDLLIAFAQGIPGLNEFYTVPSEMLRLNLAIAPTPRASQSSLGVLGLDLAGFPNGRRPGDDVVDIALQVVVAGKLCALNIGCTTSQAPIANVALTDGAPIAATDFQDAFPYLNTPIPGSRNGGKSTLNNNSGSNFSSGLTIPSFLAVTVALVVGFMTSFFFFRN